MERGQDWEVCGPFNPPGVALGHFVNLSESHLARLTICTAHVTRFLHENECENASVSYNTPHEYIRLISGYSEWLGVRKRQTVRRSDFFYKPK